MNPSPLLLMCLSLYLREGNFGHLQRIKKTQGWPYNWPFNLIFLPLQRNLQSDLNFLFWGFVFRITFWRIFKLVNRDALTHGEHILLYIKYKTHLYALPSLMISMQISAACLNSPLATCRFACPMFNLSISFKRLRGYFLPLMRPRRRSLKSWRSVTMSLTSPKVVRVQMLTIFKDSRMYHQCFSEKWMKVSDWKEYH